MRKYLRIFCCSTIVFFIFYGGLTGCSQEKEIKKEFASETTHGGQEVEKLTEQQVKSPPVLTENDIKNLLRFWENAQDAGDFEGYQSCYGKPFKGVKTTPKGSKDYNYAEWMIDRRKMIEKAIGLDVEIKNLQISIDGESATVEFDQYYRSETYSDWGPKIIKVKQTPDGTKIVYEMLKTSYRL